MENNLPPKIVMTQMIFGFVMKGNEPSPFKMLDLTMLLIGGKERTRKQFEQIFSQAGLKVNRIVPFMHDLSVVEGVAVY